jgi:hypothetical protein
MPSPELIDAFRRAKAAHTNAAQELVPVVASMALETARGVLPEATCLEVFGELNEDWLPILRIQRVLDDSGTVLFDVGVGHDDETIESTIDGVNIEHLDPLMELTGDDFMGEHIIDAEAVGDLSR